MTAALPDELLDKFTATGTPKEVRERVKQYGNIDGVDAVRIGFIDSMISEEKETTVRAIAEMT